MYRVSARCRTLRYSRATSLHHPCGKPWCRFIEHTLNKGLKSETDSRLFVFSNRPSTALLKERLTPLASNKSLMNFLGKQGLLRPWSSELVSFTSFLLH